MALATSNASGAPSVRMVLLKELAPAGYAVFYTNYGSRKAAELEHKGRAAGMLYWESIGRQVRFEGPVVRSPAAESDAYFASRPVQEPAQRLEQPAEPPARESRRSRRGRRAHRARARHLARRRRDRAPVPRPEYLGRLSAVVRHGRAMGRRRESFSRAAALSARARSRPTRSRFAPARGPCNGSNRERTRAPLIQHESITCPYCWETIEIALDLSVEEQQYVEDCSVCCRPIVIAYRTRRRDA